MLWLCLLFISPALGFLNREPPPPAVARSEVYEERWVDVRLNHFDASNTDTFPMRFYFNQLTSRDDNIVIFVGGEWAITPGWVTGGLAHDLAEIIGGSLFYTEHRYYGETRPTERTTVSELRFLTVDQALADLAQVIHHIKSEDFENGRYRNAKVVLVGCSYAGTMATWMRLSYPHLVDAAFSDSGPLHAQEDFSQYLEVVGDAIASQGGQSCYDSVETSIQAVLELMTQPAGLAQVSEIFGTCTPLISQPLDIASFHWFGLVFSFAWLAQAAVPGDISTACEALTNSSISDPVQRLASWIRDQPVSQPCIETRYSELIRIYSDTAFESPVATSRLWFYQTCVEYGWYQTTNGARQPFGSGVPLFYFQQMCRDFFSAFQSPERLSYGVSRTNLFFGGRHLPDKVVTVQGALDPWHPMGPNETHTSFFTPVYLVPEIAHCRIVHSLENSETEEVKAVKYQVLNDINRFLYGVEYAGASRVVSSAVLLVGLLLAFM